MSKPFETLLQQGKEQLEAGQYSEALETFSNLIERNSQFEEVWKGRGKVHFCQGNLEGAIADYTDKTS